MEDYEEASIDCKWNDKDQARWFSWFITAPKATWQRTLKSEDNSSQEKIVEVYKGQYGIHLDPRTAYQQCHELLDAMRNYQRMAPNKLTDETLESILWNKVPIELQKKVKEITNSFVQELLHRLLRAEAVLAECKRRSQTTGAASKLPVSNQERSHGESSRPDKQNDDRMTRKNRTTSQAAEMPA